MRRPTKLIRHAEKDKGETCLAHRDGKSKECMSANNPTNEHPGCYASATNQNTAVNSEERDNRADGHFLSNDSFFQVFPTT
ncbi:UNVERIFIED_CONTAM: hypothetical protein HHA_214390 [Hammondia hammondi]|eukprot:XP_008885361.1 hypothetical protein HHA_214390 [Hammondia hammondi]